MTFSYDITDGTTVHAIRREIGDTELDAGILPGGVNLSDEEIAWFYAQEDDDYWPAVARIFDAVAARWAAFPTVIKLGPESQTIQASEYYRQMAAQARANTDVPASVALTKVDYGIEAD